jgi:membrane-bound lytic murein transglycosylase D
MRLGQFGLVALSAALSVTLLANCAHVNHAQDIDRSQAVKNAEEAPSAIDASLRDEGPGTKNDLDDSGHDLNAIPTEVNRMVLEWIDYFQGRGREHMERYLARSTRYIPAMKEILRKEGLPEDLVYIALIESGFTPTARSSANAVGFWQFIRPTGRRYGLQADSYVDDRRDFAKSTVAAADYFKGLYNLFGSWYLAIASYNVGENRVKNVVMKYHTRDFWQLAKDRKLPKETVNYIPKFMAARLIAKDPEKYGFTGLDYAPPIEFSEVELTHAVDLRKMAQGMGVDYLDISDLNPSYKRGVALDHDGRLVLRVPKGTSDKALAAAEQSTVTDKRAFAKSDDDDVTYYKIRHGESLASIAHKFHTSSRKIRGLNNLGVRTRLVAGRKIKVPNDSTAGIPDADRGVAGSTSRRHSKYAKKASASREPQSTTQQPRVHVVRRGDTLVEIARRYNVSMSRLAHQNQLSRRGKIVVGARLEIPD